MPFLTIDEYLKIDSKHERYIRDFSNVKKDMKLLKIGFIKWVDEPCLWGGAWSDEYALVRITDYSNHIDLKSYDERVAGLMKYSKYSYYKLPHRLTKEGYISNEVMYHDSVCSRSSVNHQEWLYLQTLMTEEEQLTYKRKVTDDFERGVKEITMFPHVERPYQIYMAGNDDCSYSLAVDTKERAFEIITSLEKNPTWDDLHNKFNFQFSN